MPTPGAVYKIIWARGAGLCSFPDCRRDLAKQHPGGAPLPQGEVAHIVSEKTDGPRSKYPPPGGSLASPANFLLLCFEHHNEVDSDEARFSVPKLVAMKEAHELWVAESLATPASTRTPAPEYCEELLHSSLLPVDLMPQAIFAAPCSHSEKHVRAGMAFPKESELAFPFVVRGDDLLTFCDLEDPASPFAAFINVAKVKRHRLADWYGDEDRMRWFVDLLNRALNKLTGRRGLQFDKDHKRYYFPLGDDGSDRSVQYCGVPEKPSVSGEARARVRPSRRAGCCEHGSTTPRPRAGASTRSTA